MMDTLDGPRVDAAVGETRSLVVLLHGYGASGNDLIGLADAWRDRLPDTAFAAPNGPQPCAEAPAGHQWFPFDGADWSAPITVAGVATASAALTAFIDAELSRHRLPLGALALVGFSQGGMMALAVGLGRAGAGIVGYSGALLAGLDGGARAPRPPPVLLCHGDADPVVPFASMFDAVGRLSAARVPVRWHVAPGAGHGIDPASVALGGAFLRAALPPEAARFLPPVPLSAEKTTGWG